MIEIKFDLAEKVKTRCCVVFTLSTADICHDIWDGDVTRIHVYSDSLITGQVELRNDQRYIRMNDEQYTLCISLPEYVKQIKVIKVFEL